MIKLYLDWVENNDQQGAILGILRLFVYCRYDVDDIDGQTTWVRKICVQTEDGYSSVVLYRSEHTPGLIKQDGADTLRSMAHLESKAKKLLIELCDAGIDSGLIQNAAELGVSRV